MAGWYELMLAGQRQELARQQAMREQSLFAQQQQDRERQMRAMQGLGQALPGLMAPPQAPQPGQQSTPAQAAFGQAPTPAQQATFQPPPQQQAQPPAQPVPPAPYRPMPAAPSVPQASSIPPPPQPQQPAPPQGPLSWGDAIKALQAQGLQGADLMEGLSQLQPILDIQAKQQFQQAQAAFEHQYKLSMLQERYDALHQRSEDRSLDRDQRAQAHADSIALRRQMLQFQIQGNPETALSKDDLHFMAQQYVAAPDPSIFTNLGRGAQGAKNVVALRTAIREEAEAQGMSPQEMAARGIATQGEKAAARTAGTRSANVGLAAAEAQKTFGIVRQTSAALPRTDFVPANRAIQSFETNTGDPRVIAFGAALNTAVNAYARAISPSGTPTVSDKEHARQLLSTANTPEQVDAVLGVMEQEMSAARQAPAEVQEQQRERIAGKKGGAPSLQDLLAEKARRGGK